MASWPPFRNLVIVIRVCGGHCPAGHRGGRTVVALPPGLLALACGAPTAPIGPRAQPSRIDDLTTHAALGLALRMEASMLAVGASAADGTATVLRVAAGYGSANCQVDVTFTSLTVSGGARFHPRREGSGKTSWRRGRTSTGGRAWTQGRQPSSPGPLPSGHRYRHREFRASG